MGISIIAAIGRNRVIGRAGQIPWDIPEDRRRFKELTMGHIVAMGRKTYESIGHPLQGRKNIVLTRQTDYKAQGCNVVHSFEELLDSADPLDELFICGGAELYRQALPSAVKIFLTVVDIDVAGDTFFPDFSTTDYAELAREQLSADPLVELIMYERLR